jgi:transposase
MIDKRTIFEIHRLKHLGWSDRKIARHLRIDRGSVKKVCHHPDSVQKRSNRASKLDPYRDQINVLLDEDPTASAPVVLQRLMEAGFDGKVTIVRDYLRQLRGKRKQRRAYARFESAPGEQMQIDWGHFDSLEYGDTRRRLYALVVVEAFSRMMYVRFTHSQKQSALHSCLLEAFTWFGGSPNNWSSIIWPPPSSNAWDRWFGSTMRSWIFYAVSRSNRSPAIPRSPYEKGKVESGVKYLRRNFMPLRTFTDLDDVNIRPLTGWTPSPMCVSIRQPGNGPWIDLKS